MATLLFADERAQKAAGGMDNILCIEDLLLMILGYWREYRACFHIGQARELSESAACCNIKWCENIGAKTCWWCENMPAMSNAFRLPGSRGRCRVRAVLCGCVDGREVLSNGPKKQQGSSSRRKKRRTLKTQPAFEKPARRILCLSRDARAAARL